MAVAGRPVAGPHPGSAVLPQSRQARAEEAQGASSGATKVGTLPVLHDGQERAGAVHVDVHEEVGVVHLLAERQRGDD